MQTCAGVLLYLEAMLTIWGSFNNEGSPGFAHGRSGEPRGLYAVTGGNKQTNKQTNKRTYYQQEQVTPEAAFSFITVFIMSDPNNKIGMRNPSNFILNSKEKFVPYRSLTPSHTHIRTHAHVFSQIAFCKIQSFSCCVLMWCDVAHLVYMYIYSMYIYSMYQSCVELAFLSLIGTGPMDFCSGNCPDDV